MSSAQAPEIAAGEGEHSSSWTLPRWPRTLRLWLGSYALLGALVSLFGWIADVPSLADWDDDGIAIQPNATVAAMAAGAAILLLALGRRRAVAALGAVVALLGVSTLFQYASGVDLGIDTLLMFDRTWGRTGVVSPGRMGPPGAASWTLIGSSIVLIGARVGAVRRAIALRMALLAMVISSLSLIGYLYGSSVLYAIPTLTVIALQTASFILVVSVGLVLSVPEREPMRALLDSGAAGILARRALLGLIALPIALGFLRMRGQRAGLYDAEFGTALLVLTLIGLLLGLLWWNLGTVSAHARALRDREDRLAGILGSITDAFVTFDRNWRYTFVNDEAVTRMRVKRDDIVGRSVWDLVPEALGKQVDAVLRRAMRERTRVEYEAYDEIRQRWFANRVYPTPDGGLAVYSLDITERKRSEALLREQKELLHQSEERLRLEREKLVNLFEEAPVPVAVYEGPEHRVVVFNRKTREVLLDQGPAPTTGQPLVESLPELRGSELSKLLDEVFTSGEARSSVELPIRLRPNDGSLEDRYFTTFFQPVRGLAGEVTGVMTAGYEVTEELRLRRAALDASRAKDEFLAMLGHELRNPLAPILTSVQLMRMRQTQMRELDVIERQVAHLMRLVDDLLDISRITRGRMELRKTKLELGQVVLRGLEMASPVIEQRGQRIELQVPAEGLEVEGDLERLAQVVSNLLTNAAKYSERGTTVHVDAERSGKIVRLRVKDEGIGIPDEMLTRVFDLFYQQPQSLERSKGGLGLGLAIVRSLVDLHGGSVTAVSQGVGMGSEFIVELPLAPGVEELPAPGAGDSKSLTDLLQHARPIQKRILVVDDNVDAAESIADFLRELGFEVEMAHDGPSALTIAQAFKPNICLVDIGLPVMDGYEVAQRLRSSNALPANARIIALTGYGQDSDRRRSLEAGFDTHLVKPVSLDVLTHAIDN